MARICAQINDFSRTQFWRGTGVMLLRTARVSADRKRECIWFFHADAAIEWGSAQLRQSLRAWETFVEFSSASLTNESTGSIEEDIDTETASVLVELKERLEHMGERVETATARLSETMVRLTRQQQEIQALKRRMGFG
jgi:hypothetical protein